MSMILAGCGAEEVVSSEPAIPEEPSSVEVSEEISEESSENEVEETTDFNTIKDEVFPVGVKVSMDFGEMTRLGDNELYPDMFEDWVIYFDGQTFKMPLPKDMCVNFKWDFDMNVLQIYNEDYSKQLNIFFTEVSIPAENNKPMDMETANNVTNYYGYSILENETLTLLANEELKISEYIAVTDGTYNGNLLSLSICDSNELNERNMYEGIAYYIFYGETIHNDFNADFVVEMFQVVNDEESSINDLNPALNEDGTLNNSEKYGIPENVKLPTTATIKDVNGRIDIIIPYENEEEFITFLNDLNSNTPIVDEKKQIVPFSGEAVVEGLNTNFEILCTYEYNGSVYRLNIVHSPSPTGYGVTIFKE